MLELKYKDAIWIAGTLFERGKATGSSANMSFLHEGNIYITGSGTCFGRLTEKDFSIVSIQGEHIGGIKPSKELPIHKILYEKSPSIQAVIHTHSFYCTLWSCLKSKNAKDVIPSYTPYLKMKLVLQRKLHHLIGILRLAEIIANASTRYFCKDNSVVFAVVLGTVGLIPYAKPGSQTLFDLFAERVNDSDGYILQNHGPIIGDKDLMSAFYCLEELEESARIAWELRNENVDIID